MWHPYPVCTTFPVCAGVTQAGLGGIREGMPPPPPVSANIYDMKEEDRKKLGIETLPADLIDAVECMEADPFIREVLGDHVYTKYVEAKRQEWKEYTTRVSQWEIERYLNKF